MSLQSVEKFSVKARGYSYYGYVVGSTGKLTSLTFYRDYKTYYESATSELKLHKIEDCSPSNLVSKNYHLFSFDHMGVALASRCERCLKIFSSFRYCVPKFLQVLARPWKDENQFINHLFIRMHTAAFHGFYW